MLEVKDLHSYYGQAHVLQGASLTVGASEVVALLGRNGMGKTSLIRSVMGLSSPQVRAGAVTWKERSLLAMKPHQIARARIGYVPQGRRLFPSLTVTEHLTVLKSPDVTHGWTVERAFELFPRLAERRQHRGSQLSGGERQMLAVARALMIDPELILMDEPSEGLAPVMVQHLESIIAGLKSQGLAILLVEQNLYSALAVADRVVVLESGQTVFEAKAGSFAPDTLTHYLGVH